MHSVSNHYKSNWTGLSETRCEIHPSKLDDGLRRLVVYPSLNLIVAISTIDLGGPPWCDIRAK